MPNTAIMSVSALPASITRKGAVRDELLGIVAEKLGIARESITDSTPLASRRKRIATEAAKEFGLHFTEDQITNLITFADLRCSSCN